MDAEDDDSKTELSSREPTISDLVELCRELNERNASYIVIGGFAMRAAGLDRRTMDVDLLIDTSLDNEARVFQALATLPDQAVLELEPGETKKYNVVRVVDDILVDLMHSACGIRYEDALEGIRIHTVKGIPIPFASPELLWRMKVGTHREKDAGDLWFLRGVLGSDEPENDTGPCEGFFKRLYWKISKARKL